VSYSGVTTECAVSYGASEITVTWPGGAAAPLAAGTYYLDFDALEGGNLPDNVRQAAAMEDSTATDVPGLVADHNVLLQNLRDAGLMES
ncbi:MAG: head fiber protein, partial [Alcanivorax sp.]